MEHGNIEGRQRPDGSNEQQEAKPFPGPEDDSEEERNFPVPAEIRNIIHQVVEGNAFPVSRFALPLRPVESLEIPVEARAEVSDNQSSEQESEQRQQETTTNDSHDDATTTATATASATATTRARRGKPPTLRATTFGAFNPRGIHTPP